MREMKDSGIEWIGEIPCNWVVPKIKYLFDVISGSTPSSVEENWDGDITWITPADYNTKDKYVNMGKRNLSKMGYLSCSTYLVPLGTIVFSKRAPIGTVAITSKVLCTNQGCLSCIKKGRVSEEYYYYVLSIGTEHFELLGSGTTFKEISANNFLNCPIPFPYFEEQEKIVVFLKNKCFQIDELLWDLQRQIGILEKYKQSVITEVVTKGLNAKVEMKDSGIDWIGKIPLNWETRKIGRLFTLRNEKNFKSLDEVQLLSLYTDIGVFPHGEQEERGNKAVRAEGYNIVKKYDIVVNIILAWMGAIGISEYDGVTSPAYDVYMPDTSKVVPHYYHYVFRTKAIAGECYKYGRGIMLMRWRTYSSEFKQIPVPFPPIDEQQVLADYLDSKCAKIDKIIEEKKKQIVTIEEYKKALIFEYVTGKKEIKD